MTKPAGPYGYDLAKAPGDLSFFTLLILCDVRDGDPDIDPNDFTEALLAKAIRHTAMDDEIYILRHLLLEIADALDHPNALQKLRITKAKAGRSLTAGQRDIASTRARNISASVWIALRDTNKLEAAVAVAMQEFGIGRATVFRA